MTDLQDLFLDKLVGSPVGAGWEDGPFRVAAEIVPGKPIKFTGQYEDTTAKNAIASRLGYPLMLVEAAQGAVSLLPSEPDRRSLAMTVIRSVTPLPKQPRRPPDAYIQASVSVTRRAHALVCRDPDCSITATLDAALAAQTAARRARLLRTLYRKRCPTSGWVLETRMWLTPRTPALDRSMYAVQHCAGDDGTAIFNARYTCVAAREAARTAVLVGGVEEAVELCLELARRLGLEAG